VTELTAHQKAAGKVFYAAMNAGLEAMPPASPCDPYISWYHHPCAAADGQNRGIELHERYEYSPAYRIMPGDIAQEIPPGTTCVTCISIIVRDFFGFIWKEGGCGDCGLHVRSPMGRLVVAEERPPERKARVAREASPRPGDSYLTGP
jgi:hypothetical protein